MNDLINSLTNPTIKRIRALKQRKARDDSGLFFIEGTRIVGEAQRLADLEQLIVAPDLLREGFARQIVAQQQNKQGAMLTVSAQVFESLSAKDGPQGIAATVRQRWESLATVMPTLAELWIALDAAQDPGNIGTILRTADAVGAQGLILLGNTADPHDPSAVRASMGAIFSQRLIRANVGEFVAWAQHHQLMVVGTSDRGAEDYQALRYALPLVLLMGSEREGLQPAQLAACDHIARIPMVGQSDSLNLAVATGVMLYEIFNQQRHK